MHRIIDTCPDVLSLIKVKDEHDIRLDLRGIPARNEYPIITIMVSGHEVWTGPIIEDQQFIYANQPLDQSMLRIEIIYRDKQSHHTVVQNECITENQCLEITSLFLDGIQIHSQDLIDLSQTDYDLNETEKQAYTEVGAGWQNVKTKVLYNNGTWQLELAEPWLTDIIKKQTLIKQIFDTQHSDILTKLRDYWRSNHVV